MKRNRPGIGESITGCGFSMLGCGCLLCILPLLFLFAAVILAALTAPTQ